MRDVELLALVALGEESALREFVDRGCMAVGVAIHHGQEARVWTAAAFHAGMAHPSAIATASY